MGQEIGLWRADNKKNPNNPQPTKNHKQKNTPPKPKNKQSIKKPQPTTSLGICFVYLEQYQIMLFCASFLWNCLHIENVEERILTHHFPENLKQVAP